MQMLPAILPETAVAPGIPQKVSESSNQGTFQSVLNYESGKNDPSEPPSVEPAETRATAQNNVNHPNPGKPSSATVDKSPVQEEPDNLRPQEIVSELTSEPVLEDRHDSEDVIEPMADTDMPWTILPAPMPQMSGKMPTDQASTKLVSRKPVTNAPVLETNRANEALVQAAATTSENPGKKQPTAHLQSRFTANESQRDFVQQTNPSSESVTDRPSVLPRANDAIHRQTDKPEQVAKQPLSHPQETGKPEQVAKQPLSHPQETANNQRVAQPPVFEQSVATATQDMPQIAAAQTEQVALPSSGQLTTKPAANKPKTQPLGESRFSELLGRNQSSNSGMTSAKQTSSTTAVNQMLRPEQTAGAASRTTMAPEKQDDSTNTLKIAEGNEIELKNEVKTLLETKPQASSSPLNESADTASPAIVKDSIHTTTAIDVAPGNTAPSVDMTQGSEQTTLTGNMPLPSSVSTAPSSTQATLQTGTGVAIPEQQVMEQVIQRSSLKELEGKRQITVELHPEELGQVKLNLIQDNERMQLHLQAQTSEVRDILEKHLPRLQEALQHQGLRLETIQVSVDSQRNNAQGFFDRQQQQQTHRNPWQQNHRATVQTEERLIARPQNRANSATGLSLRI